MPDDRKISYLQQRQNAALQAGDLDVVKATQDAISGITLGTQREANALFTSGAKTRYTDSSTNLNTHRVSLVDAQAAAARDLPARAREIAQGHDAASLRRAALQVQSHKELAQYNASVRAQLIPLAAAYRLQGVEETNAVRMAIAEFNGRVQSYRSQNDPRRLLLGDGSQSAPVDPTVGGIQPPPIAPVQVPNVNINLPAWPTGGGAPPAVDRPGPIAPPPVNVPGRHDSTGQEPAALSPQGRAEYQAAKKAVAAGAPVAAVIDHLHQTASSKKLAPQDVQAIESALRGAKSGNETSRSRNTPTTTPAGLELNVPGINGPRTPFSHYGTGGSNAGSPF